MCGSTSVLTHKGKEWPQRCYAYEKALKAKPSKLYDEYFGGFFQ